MLFNGSNKIDVNKKNQLFTKQLSMNYYKSQNKIRHMSIRQHLHAR